MRIGNATHSSDRASAVVIQDQKDQTMGSVQSSIVLNNVLIRDAGVMNS
jgi:hypothetical protein